MSDRVLRVKKNVSYRNGLANLSVNEGDDSSFVVSDDKSNDSELFADRERSRFEKKPKLHLKANINLVDDDHEYRLERQKSIRDRRNVLRQFDLDVEVKELVPAESIKSELVNKRKRKPKKSVSPPRKRVSQRLLNQSLEVQYNEAKEDEQKSRIQKVDDSVPVDQRILDEHVPISEEQTEEDKLFLKSLKESLSAEYDVRSDFVGADFPSFVETAKSCEMIIGPTKVTKQRIVSLDLHPSPENIFLIAGDIGGNVALRNLISDSGITFKVHVSNVNCVSFSKQNTNKFFTTSFDGTIRRGDVDSSALQLVFSTSQLRDRHLCWHEEFGQSLLVAQGNGTVSLIDLRASETKSALFHCHPRSVRTVQLHPTNENYFLTSSGTGKLAVWDIRNSATKKLTPILEQDFDRALTSAFFSARGNYVLSTCNDDTIKVFDYSDPQKLKQTKSIIHNNHTGRWLSVFKAKWQPQREDAFFIGSMLRQRRMQLYRREGQLLHEFMADDMETVNPVIVCHSSKPIYVGGNGSGKIHVFAPYPSLSDM